MMTASSSSRDSNADTSDASAFMDETPEVRELFELAVSAFNFTGKDVLQKLAAGEPLGGAAGIPPECISFLYGRAHDWLKAGYFDSAEQIFHTICMADPGVPDYWAGLGFCLARRSEWQQALLAFEKALELKPDWRAMQFYRLEALVHLEDWPNAARQYELSRPYIGEVPADLAYRTESYKTLIKNRLGRAKIEETGA